MYVVDVLQDGAKFPGSPFQIQIGDTDVCSAAKVKVSGAMREGMTQQWNDVVIDVADAGIEFYSVFFYLLNLPLIQKECNIDTTAQYRQGNRQCQYVIIKAKILKNHK